MGKGGGGGGQPTSTTAYQTNLPEYAKPYVMNMLGAAQNQLFTTTPGANGQPGEITGFKPYTPYSTDPTQYFAGPSSLQQGVYGEAARMQTPGQYAPATGLAGIAGMGQLGAGQQYASQATSPGAVGAYMSPYQQQVTDIAKMNAVREAQIAGQQANLGAARQGTYGGARQALAGAERERNLLSNLSNIQAQGSQAAYDKAIQNMQYGANLGLQGLAGAASTAGTLGGLGTAQQQADLARMGFQQQTGAAQQQYQQGIINQAIQDYATAQQYPYMQLSTMSNLLRGLPMQGMTTQQYQAQPGLAQQSLGLLGTGASLYNAFGKREGGTIKEYASGGAIGDMRARLEDMADTDPQGLAKLVAQSNSKEIKKIGNEILSGIAMGNTGKLGTNMAGGGIIAFEGGGPAWEDLKEEDKTGWRGPLDVLGDIYNPGKRVDPVTGKAMGENEYRALLEQRDKKAKAIAQAEKDKTPPVDETPKPPAAAPAAPSDGTTGTQTARGIQDFYKDKLKAMGLDEGPGAKSEALMKALEERQAGLQKGSDADRWLRAAEAFSKFGSTAGPIGVAASEALGGFAKGEAAARKDEEKMKVEGMKMQADLEKARRAELRGDYDAAQKAYDSAEDRKNRIETAQIGASAAGQATQLEREAIAKYIDSGMTYQQAYEAVKGAGRQESVELQRQKAVLASLDAQILTAKKEEKAKLQAQRDAIYKQMVSGSGAPGGGSGKVDTSNPLLK